MMEQCRLCPAKLWSNADLAPQNHRPLVLCSANHGDFVLCPAEIWSNADFAPQNHGDIVHRAPLHLESCSGKDCPGSISS